MPFVQEIKGISPRRNTLRAFGHLNAARTQMQLTSPKAIKDLIDDHEVHLIIAVIENEQLTGTLGRKPYVIMTGLDSSLTVTDFTGQWQCLNEKWLNDNNFNTAFGAVLYRWEPRTTQKKLMRELKATYMPKTDMNTCPHIQNLQRRVI